MNLFEGNALLQLIDRLRGVFVGRDKIEKLQGLNVGTATGASVGQIRASADIYPKQDAVGVFTRLVDRVGAYTDHFRSGAIPSGFSWQGSPFDGVPTTLAYNYSLDYLAAIANSSGGRVFLSKPVTYTAGAWQNKSFFARLRTGVTTIIGVRADNGTDDNYAEMVADASAANGAYILKFRYRTGGGAVTVYSGPTIPADTYSTIRLYCYWDGSQYVWAGYLMGEEGLSINITGFNTPAVPWVPAIGRVGVMVEKNNGAYGLCDLIYTSFG